MKEKLKEAYDYGKDEVLGQKGDILLEAKDLPDCLKLMKEAIVDAVTAFTDQDDFLKEVPQSVIDDLEKDLRSKFENGYVTKNTICFFKEFNEIKKPRPKCGP